MLHFHSCSWRQPTLPFGHRQEHCYLARGRSERVCRSRNDANAWQGRQVILCCWYKFDKLFMMRRPQFDDSAIAVIITKHEKAEKYEKLVAGEELLESW